MPIERNIAETYFAGLDRHFADFMIDLAGETSPDDQNSLWLAAALVSRIVGDGHVCLNLSEQAGMSLAEDNEAEASSLVCPGIDEWTDCLRRQSVVGRPGEFKPLVLDEKSRLYLYRYWLYEQQLAESMAGLVKQRPGVVDKELVVQGLKRFFPQSHETVDWQCIAAVLAVLNRITVISGGPGTGKTYTVGRILGLLIEQARDLPVSIALAAPTGKAAARLSEMVNRIRNELDLAHEVKGFIPESAVTIHRLLGSVYGGKSFRYNEANRLPFDVVVIDEASMVDLPLMAKLVIALRETARLILLGDKDQLASVEPGAVFGDICHTTRFNTFSRDVAGTIKELTSVELPHAEVQESMLQDSIVVLEKSFRFGPESGIGLLASAVKECRFTDVMDLLKGPVCEDVRWREIPSIGNLEEAIEDVFRTFYDEYMAARSPEEAFSLFDRVRLLCALRHGPYGVVALNGVIERMCRRIPVVPKTGRWYKCRPVMVTSNDYHLKLFNGDVGILFPDQDADGQLRVYFPSDNGRFRRLLPGRLRDFETVYAMTVHKSQGSEFDHVVVLLPDRPSRVVTRELLYTAVTRAKKSVEIWGSEEVLCDALSRATRRESGLKDMLS